MRPSIVLQNHRDAIREIALSHRVNNVSVFGSVLHGDDTDKSDLQNLLDRGWSVLRDMPLRGCHDIQTGWG